MIASGDIVQYGDERRVVIDVDGEGWAALRRADDDPERRVDAEGGDIDIIAVDASTLSPVGHI